MRSVAITGLFMFGCVPAGGFSNGDLAVQRAGEVGETSTLGLSFDEAAEKHGVPSDLLKAIAYVETGLEPAKGVVEFDGQPAPFGYFGLRGAALDRAAVLIGKSVDEIIGDEALGIEAGAALLADRADALGLVDRANPAAWAAALEAWGEHDEEMRGVFTRSVLEVLRLGAAVPMEDGSTLIVRRYSVPFSGPVATTASGLDAAGALWRPSPNFGTRGTRPELVIIHTCEGAYSGCVSWLRNSASQVSAHYVVNESGSEVSQLVAESGRAWHVSARYRRSLNGSQIPGREGQSINDFSIGIEHGGSASQRSFPAGQIQRSVELVQGITARNNIPRDRYHIVAHGRLQPESRNDPGPNWPWTSYIQSIAGGAPPPANPPPANPPPANPPPTGAIITVDNATPGRFRASSGWESSDWAAGKIGSDYRFRRAALKTDLAEYKIAIPGAGRYEVMARIPGNGYATNVPYVIHHRGGRTVVQKDISRAGAQWLSLGTYDFAAGDDWSVQISCWVSGNGIIIADAIRLEPR